MFERDAEIARSLALPSGSVVRMEGKVMRDGREEFHDYLQIDAALEVGQASEVMAVWKAFEPDREYFRVVSTNAVVIVDPHNSRSVYCGRHDDTEIPIELDERPEPAWHQRLEALLKAS